jgi:hypothetical protein
LIKTAYEKAGGEIEVKMVPGKGHAEVSEFFRDQDLLEFIFKHAKESKNRHRIKKTTYRKIELGQPSDAVNGSK